MFIKTEAPRRAIIESYVEQQGGPKNLFSTSTPQPLVQQGRSIITQEPNVMQRAYKALPLVKGGSFKLSFGLDDAIKAIS